MYASRRAPFGPYVAICGPYFPPLVRFDMVFFGSGFHRGALPAFFVRVCPKMAEATQHGRSPSLYLSLSLRRKGVEPNRPFPCHYKNLAVSNRLPFSLFQTHPLWRLIARIKKHSSTAFLHGTDHDGCSRAWLGNLRFDCL